MTDETLTDPKTNTKTPPIMLIDNIVDQIVTRDDRPRDKKARSLGPSCLLRAWLNTCRRNTSRV